MQGDSYHTTRVVSKFSNGLIAYISR